MMMKMTQMTARTRTTNEVEGAERKGDEHVEGANLVDFGAGKEALIQMLVTRLINHITITHKIQLPLNGAHQTLNTLN